MKHESDHRLSFSRCSEEKHALTRVQENGAASQPDSGLLLHLLHSPARSLGFTILDEIFANVTVVVVGGGGFFLFFFPFNPTIQVVTFRLRGWCMVGVFLLPAFTHQGHERHDLLSLCDGIYVCADQTSVYTLVRKSLGE